MSNMEKNHQFRLLWVRDLIIESTGGGIRRQQGTFKRLASPLESLEVTEDKGLRQFSRDPLAVFSRLAAIASLGPLSSLAYCFKTSFFPPTCVPIIVIPAC